ncbi:lectin C-type domain protein [Teladorsagia circumcincta]|uniref:Lectin C-type domain protein n=1 Tax=Teladorsagia circumcincta TaxID=45464 RepID=A0A2G9UAB6_TELCI|nr:lectin C-type domain protein [Teladorsagia circumcincta]
MTLADAETIASSAPKFCDVRYANTAEDACKKNGGHLVTICSEEENTFVGYMANFQNDYYNNRINTWIGLYRDPKNKNNWLWKSGETCGYRNWHQHEPNNEGGNEENVHFFSSHDQLTWNDNQKEEYFYYICERKTCPLDDQ